MARAAQNDASAFGDLVRAHELRISRFALRMLSGDYALAQDVTQETFLRIWRGRAEYVPSGQFASFVLRVAHRLCLDSLRRIARQNALADAWANVPDAAPGSDFTNPDLLVPSAEQVACQRSLADAVRVAISQLPENERAVFILSHYEAAPYQEIARVLDCPMGTVASRKNRAVRLLRTALADWNPGAEEKTNE